MNEKQESDLRAKVAAEVKAAQAISRAHIAIIEIVIDNGDGSQTTANRDADYKWKIDGPIFPRHIAMLTGLNDLIRDAES